jgi:hypothetical protein
MQNPNEKTTEEKRNTIAYWSLIISICAMIGTLSQAALSWNMRHSNIQTALLSERIKFCGEFQSLNAIIASAFVSSFNETQLSPEERQSRKNRGLSDWKVDLLNLSIRLNKKADEAILLFPKETHEHFRDLNYAFKSARDNIEINEHKIQNLAYDGYARRWFAASGKAQETCRDASAMTSASPFR